MTLHMRAATRDDLPAIVELLADDVNGRQREDASLPLDPGYIAAFDAMAADPNQHLIVAELDGRVVGTLQLSFLPGLSFKGAWRGQIEAVRIASDLRSQGLGKQMLDWTVDRCRERGCRMVQLTSKADRIAAHRFYVDNGWEQSHLGFKLHLHGGR